MHTYTPIYSYTHTHTLSLSLYIYIYTHTHTQGAYDKFPDFFRMGTFFDSTHMKL